MSAKPAKDSGERPTVSGGQAERPSVGTHGQPSVGTLWRSPVSFGLLLVQVGFGMTVAVMCCFILAVMWSNYDVAKIWLLILALNLAGCAAGMSIMCGKLLCLRAPPQMSGKAYIVFAVLIDFFALVLCVTAQLKVLPPLLVATSPLLSVIAFVFFVLFLRQLGNFLGDSEITGLAAGILQMGVWIVLLSLLLFGFAAPTVSFAIPRLLAQAVFAVLAVALFAVWMIGVIGYVGLLSTCRFALDRSD